MADKINSFKKESIKSYWEEQRAEEQAFYQSAAWKKCRNLFLIQNPVCRECELKQIDESATEVHHIKPRRENPELQFSFDNLEPLCKPCHSKKTRKEMICPVEAVVLLGYPEQTTKWIEANRQPGDLIFDAQKLKAAIGQPDYEPADITTLLNTWRGELFRLMKLEQIKRRVIVLATDYSTAASTAKDLGCEVITASG